MPSDNIIIADIRQDTIPGAGTVVFENELNTLTDQPEIGDTVAADTAKSPKATSAGIAIKTDSTLKVKKYDATEAENVFKRIRERDSRIKQQTIAKQQWKTQQKEDTEEIISGEELSFLDDTTDYFQGKNFIQHIPTDIVVIKTSQEEADTTTKSLQAGEKKIEKLPYKKEKQAGDWVLGVVIALLLLFIWLRLFYNRYLVQFVRATYNYLTSVNLYRNKNILFSRTAFVLNIIFATGLGLFLFHVFDFYDIRVFKEPPFTRFLYYTGCIISVYIVKYMVCHILGFLFYKKELFSEYLHNVLLFNKNIGLYLIPVVVVLPYVPRELVKWLIFAGFIIVGILLLLRLSRSLQIIISKNVFLFYLILYLCILEILPLLIAYKVLFA